MMHTWVLQVLRACSKLYSQTLGFQNPSVSQKKKSCCLARFASRSWVHQYNKTRQIGLVGIRKSSWCLCFHVFLFHVSLIWTNSSYLIWSVSSYHSHVFFNFFLPVNDEHLTFQLTKFHNLMMFAMCLRAWRYMRRLVKLLPRLAPWVSAWCHEVGWSTWSTQSVWCCHVF